MNSLIQNLDNMPVDRDTYPKTPTLDVSTGINYREYLREVQMTSLPISQNPEGRPGYTSSSNSLYYQARDLSNGAFRVLMILISYGKNVFPTIPSITKEMRCCGRTIMRYLDELEEKGFIKRVKETGKNNHYTIAPELHIYWLRDKKTKMVSINSLNDKQAVSKTSLPEDKPVTKVSLPEGEPVTPVSLKKEHIKKNTSKKNNNKKESVDEFFKEINQKLKSRSFEPVSDSSESRVTMEKLQGNGFDDNEEYLGFVLDRVSEKDNPTGYFLTSIKQGYYRGLYEKSKKKTNGYLDDWSERIRCEIEEQKKIKAESDWAQDFWDKKKDQTKIRAERKEMDEAQWTEAIKMEEKAKREDMAKRMEKLQVDMDILHVPGIPVWYVKLYGELMRGFGGKELSEREMSEQLRSKIFEMQKLKSETPEEDWDNLGLSYF